MYVGWSSAKSGLKRSLGRISEETRIHCSHLIWELCWRRTWNIHFNLLNTVNVRMITVQVTIIVGNIRITNKNSTCTVLCGQWITAAHKQRRKFPWWKVAISPCWSATGSLNFCKVFREISETSRVLSTTCNSATDKPVLKTENPAQFHYWTTQLSSPLSGGQLLICRAKTPHPKRIKRYS